VTALAGWLPRLTEASLRRPRLLCELSSSPLNWMSSVATEPEALPRLRRAAPEAAVVAGAGFCLLLPAEAAAGFWRLLLPTLISLNSMSPRESDRVALRAGLVATAAGALPRGFGSEISAERSNSPSEMLKLSEWSEGLLWEAAGFAAGVALPAMRCSGAFAAGAAFLGLLSMSRSPEKSMSPSEMLKLKLWFDGLLLPVGGFFELDG
jgi:hypothetical protein